MSFGAFAYITKNHTTNIKGITKIEECVLMGLENHFDPKRNGKLCLLGGKGNHNERMMKHKAMEREVAEESAGLISPGTWHYERCKSTRQPLCWKCCKSNGTQLTNTHVWHIHPHQTFRASEFGIKRRLTTRIAEKEMSRLVWIPVSELKNLRWDTSKPVMNERGESFTISSFAVNMIMSKQ